MRRLAKGLNDGDKVLARAIALRGCPGLAAQADQAKRGGKAQGRLGLAAEEYLTEINAVAWRPSYTYHMEDSYHFKVTARLLREGASRPSVSKEKAAEAKSLAEYFEILAVDPSTEIADKRFT